MSTINKAVQIIFNAKDETGPGTLSAMDNLRRYADSAQSITQPVSDFTKGAAKLEAGLLAAGLAVAVFSVKTAGEFDSAFRQISTIIDASAEDLAGFKAAILDYAGGSTQSLEQITNALGAAIGSGVDWSESLGLIAVAEKLSVATRSDLDSTTKVLVSTLNSYGMEINEAGKLSDLFFKIIDEGDISMSDLSNSFSKVAPIAKAAGIPIEEIGAAIATLTATGIAPATAIESLAGAIGNIVGPSKQARDLADELGINFSAAGLKADGLAGLMGKVAAATGGNSAQMKLLFGDMNAWVAATTLAGPQMGKFNEILAAMGNAAGATDAAFLKVKDSLEISSKVMENAFKALLTTIGTPLLDEFGGMANSIAAIFKALATSVKEGGLKDLAGYIESVFQDIQKSMEQVAKNLPAALATADFSGFKKGIDAVMTAIKSLFGDLDLTSAQGLKTAIELAGTAFLGLSKYVGGTIEVFKPLFDTLVAVGKGAQGLDLSILELAGNLGGIASQLNVVLPLFTGLLTILTVKQGLGLVADLKELPGVLGAASTAAGGLATSIGKAGLVGAALAGGVAIGDGLNPHINKMVTEISGSENTLGTWIYNMLHGADEAKRLGLGAKEAAAGIGAVKTASTEAAAAVDTAQQSFRKSEIAAQGAATATQQVANASKDVSKYALETVPVYDKLTGAITGYEQKLVASAKGTIDLGKASESAKGELEKINEKLGTSAEVMDALSRKTNLTNKEMIELAKVTKEAEVKLEGIASNERVKTIEATVKLNIANVEANAKIAQALIEGINETIKTASANVKDMFTILANPNAMDWSTYRSINEQVKTDNQMKKDAFDLQKKLTEAQIDSMKAQTKAMESGNGLIKITGDGLEPHLEAFMWQILKNIQTRVNKDGMKLLLGV